MLTAQETFLSKILNKHNDRDLLRVPKPNKMKYFKCFILRNGTKFINSKAFYKCISLSEVVFPKSITYIGSRAFSWCTLLDEVNLPKEIIKNLKMDAFQNHTKINLI